MPFSPSKRPFGWLAPAVAAVCAALMMAAPSASATPSESVLHAFTGNASDGLFPDAGLVADGAGNLYGTTQEGGAPGHDGVVFKLAPNGVGGYTESVLYSFTGGASDGAAPVAGLIVDGAGNLYGTAIEGGPSNAGVVFKLASNGAGGYTESVLYSFTGGSDGQFPAAGLIADGVGNLYGTTEFGGPSNAGVVFKLAPNGAGGYTESVLHAFTGTASDGAFPLAGLIADGAGNLYGTTEFGGAPDAGVVFKLAPNGAGGYTESVLYAFTGGSDGAFPVAGLIADGAGNLYGTTQDHGASSGGVVFKLSGTGFVPPRPLAVDTANAGAKSVSVIDPATNAVIATVKVGPDPVQVAVTPNGSAAYVPNAGANSVSVINTSTNTVTATVTVGVHPLHAAISPDGQSVYVANLGSASVSVLSTASNGVVAIIPVGSLPTEVAFSPDGTRAYVANAGSASLSVINTASRTVSARLPVGLLPAEVAFSPDGNRAYVTDTGSNAVTVIDNGASPAVLATVRVGLGPVAIALSPDGTRAYVANAGTNTVSVLNTATNAVVATLKVGANPAQLAITPNGATLYVANAGARSVSVINTATNAVAATLGVGTNPVDVTISLDGTRAYVTNAGSNSVSVVNTATNAVIATVPVGATPVNAAAF